MTNDATVMSFNESLAWCTRLALANIDLPDEDRLRGVLLDGPPGCGKTALRHPLARAIAVAHQSIIKLGHHEVYEVAGLPVALHDTKRTHFYPSADMLPPDGLMGGLLMTFDETGDLNISQQNLLCQMLYEGRIHSYVFPKRTFFFLTSNRVSDRSGANRIITKLNNRIARATMKPYPEEQFEFGSNHGWNPVLLAWIKKHGGEPINPSDKRPDAPTLYNSFDPSDNTQLQFSSNRSLKFVSDYLNYIDQYEPRLPDGHVLTDVSSMAGQAVAGHIVGYRKNAKTMPDVDAILRGEKVPPCPTDILWALTLTLVNKVKKENVKHMHAYLDKGPHEFLATAARLCFDNRVGELSGKDFHAMIRNPKITAMFPNAKQD